MATNYGRSRLFFGVLYSNGELKVIKFIPLVAMLLLAGCAARVTVGVGLSDHAVRAHLGTTVDTVHPYPY